MVPWFGDLGFILRGRLGVGALRRLFLLFQVVSDILAVEMSSAHSGGGCLHFFALDVGASGAFLFIVGYRNGHPIS